WLEDVTGHRFMDFHGNNVHHVGYGHPRLVDAVVRQIGALPFTPRRFTDEAAIELAEKLVGMWPAGRAGKVLLATGGSAAIEIALKLARFATGRYKTISFYGSYHGSGLGALSVGGRYRDRSPRLGPLLPGALHVPPFYGLYRAPGVPAPDAEEWARLSLESVRTIFREEGDIAAMVAEPIRSTPYVPPAWYWPEIRALCDDNGTLLIFDEIPTGLGKTGRLFASEHVGVRPDMTVLGKSLGGGILPLAAVIADGALDVAPELSLGHYTHEKNPVTARAALATIEIIEAEGLVENARRVGAMALERLRAIEQRCPLVRAVRGIGLLLAIDVGADGRSGRTDEEVARSIAFRLLERGVGVPYGSDGVITMSAPLVITEAEMTSALDRLAQTIEDEQRAIAG